MIGRLRRAAVAPMILDAYGHPMGPSDFGSKSPCDHGITFDAVAARGLPAVEVQRRWPRGWGECPKGCGYTGIAYASYEHYLAGDW